MKKIISLILCTLLLISSFAFTVSANEEIKIKIDGEYKTFDVSPVIISDRVLVPMRGIFETLGARIGWEETTKMVLATKGEHYVSVQIGNTDAFLNGEKIVLDVAPQIVNSRTLVPIRFVSESLGCKVDWDDATKTVVIQTEDNVTETISKVAIVKLDDLGYSTYQSFNKAYEFFKSYGINNIGIGAIASKVEAGKGESGYDEFISTVKKWIDNGTEIWNHGYLHKRESSSQTEEMEGYEYFSVDSYETQYSNLKKAVDIINEAFDYKVRTFGSPYNACSPTTVKVLKENYNVLGMETVMLGETLKAGKGAFKDENGNPTTLPMNLGTDVRFEKSTGVCSYEEFLKRYEKNIDAPVIVMQGHAAQWDETDYEEVKKTVEFLIKENVTFMTPSQYYDYVMAK
ncbi:MAG: DUF2334 domain-containing protein [Ruminococcaceae bacterium]|nr:DUF2334 domain-containing protein [Oscillospiraceae bacterium]